MGGATFVAGTWGDSQGWWAPHAFLSNVASSATSGLLGLPFALVVIQHIAARQADIRERREVQHLAARLAAELAADARRLSRPSGLSALQSAIRDARTTLAAPEPNVEVIRRAYELWAEVVSPPVNSQVLLSRMAATWRSLQDDVRQRLVRAGGSWLDTGLVHLLDETLSDALSPESVLSWMDGIRPAGADLSPARIRHPRGTEVHMHRLDQADRYTRQVERVTRYADDVRRHFGEPGTAPGR
jgi:hypothetical protein